MTKLGALLFTILYLSISMVCLVVAVISYVDSKCLDDSDSSFKQTYEYRSQKENAAFRTKASLVASIVFLLIFLLASSTSEFNPSILLN